MAEQTDKKTEQTEQETTPIHKQWWFWVIIVLILAIAGYFGMGMMKKPEQSFAYYF